MVTSSRPRTELRRMTVTFWNDAAQVTSVHGYGWAWRCTCGERGPIRDNRNVAQRDKREHEQGHR